MPISKLFLSIISALWLMVTAAFGYWLSDIHSKVNDNHFVRTEAYQLSRKELCDRIDRFEDRMDKRLEDIREILEKIREDQKKALTQN